MKKKRKPNWYSIFIIPEGCPGTKKLNIPRWVPRSLAIFGASWIVITILLVGAVHYYRSGWLATSDIRNENKEIMTAKAHVDERLASIEQVTQRAERLASRLETAVGIDNKVMRVGIGPISEDDSLPDPKELTLNNKTELGDVSDPQLAFGDLELKMDKLDDAIASVEMRLQEVYEFHQGKLSYWASIPSIWPVRGWVTSDFGVRHRPRGIGSRFHEGIDIAASTGTPVYASGDGVVSFVGYKHGLGKTIIIDHGFGISTIYGHNSQLYVREGDKIRRGSSIAAVGRTGRATGPHLHYQVIVDGVPVDPMRYILDNF